MTANKTIPVKPETKRQADQLKEETGATSFDDLVVMLMEDSLDVSLEEIETVERSEEIERTRATVVAILEAVEESDLTEEVLEIVETLSQQDMLAKNQEIIDHLLVKARNEEPLNEMDRLLAEIVMETESSREMEQSPAAEIAQGLFAETDTTTTERTTTTRQETTQTASAAVTEPLDSDDDGEKQTDSEISLWSGSGEDERTNIQENE